MSVTLKNLKERGMLQYFFHSPLSSLPVRDVRNDLKKGHKTEPHIEIGAENYLNCCYQQNIKSFLKNDAKYLFLFTMCKNTSLKYYGTQYIIGILEKEDWGMRDDKCWFVKGPTKIYNFKDSISVKNIFGKNLSRSDISTHKWVDENLTRKLLEHFKEKDSILKDCIKEIQKLDPNNLTCKKNQCKYIDECLRNKM